MGDQNTQQIDQGPVNQPTTENSKTNYLIIGLVVFICFVIFGFGGYYLGKQSPISDGLTDDCITEKDSILSIVTNFETLQKNKDSKSVLALFTAPQLQNEISDYQNISGKDANIEPRLYNTVSTNFNTQSYKVIQQPLKSMDNSCIVEVEEQRSNYGGPANPQYLPAQTENFSLTFRKQGDEWKIDRYQSLDPKIKTGKYSGFLMEYAN